MRSTITNQSTPCSPNASKSPIYAFSHCSHDPFITQPKLMNPVFFAPPAMCMDRTRGRGGRAHLHSSFSPLHFRSRISAPFIGSAHLFQVNCSRQYSPCSQPRSGHLEARSFGHRFLGDDLNGYHECIDIMKILGIYPPPVICLIDKHHLAREDTSGWGQ